MSKPKQAKESELSKTRARIAESMADRYFQKVAPVESRAISEITNNADERRQAMGASNVDSQMLAGQQKLGINPGQLAVGGINTAQRMAEKAGAVDSGVARNTLANSIGLVQAGQGRAGASLSNISSLASEANRQEMIKAEASNAARASMGQDVGQALGLGASMYGNVGEDQYLRPETVAALEGYNGWTKSWD